MAHVSDLRADLGEDRNNTLDAVGKFAAAHKEELIFGAAFGALSYAGAALDAKMNPDIMAALKANHEWWRFFTTRHFMSYVTLTHPAFVTGVMTGVGALYGALRRWTS